jgi:hypothetical protein
MRLRGPVAWAPEYGVTPADVARRGRRRRQSLPATMITQPMLCAVGSAGHPCRDSAWQR